jgi:thioredoxin-related protein
MAETIQWRGNWEEAAAEAKKVNLPLLLEFYLEGCPHCAQLDRETHGDAAVAAAVNVNFIPVRLEGRGHMDLVQKLAVRGAPTTLIFSPEGKELRRFAGFLAPPEYLREIQGAT